MLGPIFTTVKKTNVIILKTTSNKITVPTSSRVSSEVGPWLIGPSFLPSTDIFLHAISFTTASST